ncbi:MAG TPA: hypothetical protein VKS79_11555 [Gemmataceae bacterium]|nr:hypothetical protein [Gemmataceae bacterium]
MAHRCIPLTLFAFALFTTRAIAQIPETASPLAAPAEVLLPPSPDWNLDQPSERLIHQPGWYAAGGVLVAPPILFAGSSSLFNFQSAVLPPLPSPWATIGFRRDNDVSWQTSFLLVPLYDANGTIFGRPYGVSTVGLDVDRISTNHSAWPGLDMRWQIGLRIVGIGVDAVPIPFALGPHVGLRFEWPLRPGLSLFAWPDVGVLPSLFLGIPIVDLRGEVGFSWRPLQVPGLSLSASAFNEAAGFGIAGLLTPGVKARLAWNY